MSDRVILGEESIRQIVAENFADDTVSSDDIAFANAIARDVLEEAAKLCEQLVTEHGLHSNFICAMELRKRKPVDD